MKSSGILVVLVALFSILIALPLAVLAETQTLTFWDGDGGAYSSTQAAYVNWIGTVNYGSATTLVVSVDIVVADFTPGRRLFVRFPDIIGINPGQIPAGSTIESATLRLTRVNSSTHVAYLYAVNSEWDESTITGDNVPDYDHSGSVGSVPAGDAGGHVATITGIVQAWASGTPNWGLVSLAGYSPTTFVETFASDDATLFVQRPRLTVTFTPPTLNPTQQSTWGRVKALYRG